ncbi:MAG: hypothetical protein AAF750_17750 [Planctomycetota bacterium]
MTDLPQLVAETALWQAFDTLNRMPDDASISLRCNVVNTAVRALTAFFDARPSELVDLQQGAAESPA